MDGISQRLGGCMLFLQRLRNVTLEKSFVVKKAKHLPLQLPEPLIGQGALYPTRDEYIIWCLPNLSDHKNLLLKSILWH